MRSATEIRSQLRQTKSDCERVIAQAELEQRELREDEATYLRKMLGGNADDGELGILRDELKRAEEQSEFRQRAAAKLSSTLADQMDENGLGTTPAKWNRDSRGRGFAILNKAERATDIFRPKAANEFGHYILAKTFGVNRSTPESIRAAMGGNDNSLGGFLVPERLSSEVIDLARAKSVLMQAGTRTVLMDSDNLTIPKLEGDVTVATKAENAAWTASNMTFGARKLDTHTAGALVKMSQELYEDSPDLLAEQLGRFMGSALAVQIDEWGLNGSGSAEPLGILGYSAIGTTGSIGAIDWLDPAVGAAAIRASNHEPGACIMHPTIYDDLLNIVTGDGVNSARGWLAAPPTLANVQFLATSNCPLAKMVIGDFTRYMMGVRTQARVEISNQAGEAFERYQIWARITMRFDFVTLDDTAFHILTGITS